MRAYIGSDHAGYELKNALVTHLSASGHEVTDIGPASFDPDDDYPPFCLTTASRVVSDPGSLGIVVGGSGNGEQIAANKVPGARAALAWNHDTARLAREHNDANVISLGARMHTEAEAFALIETFLSTEFTGSDRHSRRIGQLADYEKTHRLPSLH